MSLQETLVSIIIPTYNRAHLIGETLDSVLAQTYTNWECIVVDDGSTDTTATVVKGYVKKDKRFQYHKRPDTHLPGGNGARNHGFELSRGDYIQWFDSDDLMLNNKIEVHLIDLKDSDYDFSVTQSERFDVKKKVSLGIRSESLFSNNLIDDFINFKTFWQFQSVLYKKNYLVANNLYTNELLQQAQDYDFHLSVLKLKPKYCYNDVVTTTIRIHDTNMGLSMIDKPGKIYSNAYVQYRIISEFKDLISNKTFINSQMELVNYYREALRRRQKRNAYNIFKLAVMALTETNFSSIKKGALIFKYILGLLYPFSGIGFKFTKIYYEE